MLIETEILNMLVRFFFALIALTKTFSFHIKFNKTNKAKSVLSFETFSKTA